MGPPESHRATPSPGPDVPLPWLTRCQPAGPRASIVNDARPDDKPGSRVGTQKLEPAR